MLLPSGSRSRSGTRVRSGFCVSFVRQADAAALRPGCRKTPDRRLRDPGASVARLSRDFPTSGVRFGAVRWTGSGTRDRSRKANSHDRADGAQALRISSPRTRRSRRVASHHAPDRSAASRGSAESRPRSRELARFVGQNDVPETSPRPAPPGAASENDHWRDPAGPPGRSAFTLRGEHGGSPDFGLGRSG